MSEELRRLGRILQLGVFDYAELPPWLVSPSPPDSCSGLDEMSDDGAQGRD